MPRFRLLALWGLAGALRFAASQYSSAPSLAPSSTPSATASPTKYRNPDKFSWIIERLGDAVIAFNDAAATEEIQFNYNISRRDTEVVIYEVDCKTEVPDSVVGVGKSLSPTSPFHGNLEVDLDIKQDTIVGSSIWTDPGDDMQIGYISLCIRLDLLLDDVNQTSVHFHETKIVLTIDLTQGFTVSEVIDLDRNDAAQEAQDTDLEYSVSACQCDEYLTCITETVTNGDDVYICLETNATNVEFVSIESLNFVQTTLQGTLTKTPISNGAEDSMTSTTMQGHKCSIRTQMTSAFFVEDDPADMLAEGVAIMAFTGSNRRLRANIINRRGRQGDENEPNESVGFDVVFGLVSPGASSASLQRPAAAMAIALSSAFFFF